MDYYWDDIHYDTTCWDSSYNEEFFSSYEREENISGYGQIYMPEPEFYLPEELNEEGRRMTQHRRTLFPTHDGTNKNDAEKDSTQSTNNAYDSNAINKNTNKGILKRKASVNNNNNNVCLPTKRKNAHSDTKCSVCFVNGFKYKFPCCGESYCSVACFKKHDRVSCMEKLKSTPNIIRKEEEQLNQNGMNDVPHQEARDQNYKNHVFFKYEREDTYDEDSDMEEYPLTEEQKKKIRNDLTLKMLLKNNHVRSVFREFILAKDKITYLSHYISDPIIIQVLDQIMKSMEAE